MFANEYLSISANETFKVQPGHDVWLQQEFSCAKCGSKSLHVGEMLHNNKWAIWFKCAGCETQSVYVVGHASSYKGEAQYAT